MWIGTLAAVCGIIAILTRRAGEMPRDAARVYATRPYQQAAIALGDGTRVTLAPQTTLRVSPFGTHARTVELERGEAYFEVAHASGAPFVVRSGAATAQVLGTAFLVRHTAHDAHVHVAVAEGKVRVTTPGRVASGVTLTAGQSGDITDSTAQIMTADDQTPDIERAPGRIMFRHTPLARVLQTVSQWYGYQFRYADATLGARNVTISVSTRSSAEVLAAIEQVLLVNLTVVGDTVTLVPHPPRSHQNAPRIRTYDVWTPTREVGR
jgi:transmembrane sensor